MKRAPFAVIFDMDGVLLDTENIAKQCWKAAAEKTGWTGWEETYLSVVGNSMDVQQAAMNQALGEEGGTRLTFLLEMKADHLWYTEPRMRGTLTAACGGETNALTRQWHSHYRRLGRHYIFAVTYFEGDLLEEEELTLTFANEERSFTLPITLKGGDVHEP